MINEKYYYTALVNFVSVSILVYLGYVGILQTAIHNDQLFIMPSIVLVSLVGFVSFLLKRKGIAEWCLDATVNLGFMGTLVGVWTAFSALDASQIGDINSIVAIVGSLISGIGTAIWTTLVGLYFYLWLGINYEVLTDD